MDTTNDIAEFLTYTAEAGSATQQALDLLASWTATPDKAETY